MQATQETRRESYRTTRADIANLQSEVLAVITAVSPYGIGAWSISEKVGRYVHSIRPRLTELRKKGLIKTIGRDRGTPTGRPEAVWALA